MDFTEAHKQTNGLVAFSPGGSYILTAISNRLVVRRVDTFQIARTVLVDDVASGTVSALAANPTKASASATSQEHIITHVGWSADAELYMAACSKRGRVVVYKMRDEAWIASISAGAEGLIRVEFAPDARSILCFSEWGLRVTVWSLVTGGSTYIQYPVHPDKGYAFRKDGRYFVLAERHKSKDTIGIYDVKEHFRLVRHYALPTSTLSSIAISPMGNHLAVWEGPLEYKLYILSLSGDLQGSFSPSPDPGFGIRSVAWHPLGHYLAVGGWDDKVHILDSLTWNCVMTLELRSRILSGVTIWREPLDWLEATHGHGFVSYERLSTPHACPLVRADPTKAYPKSGVVQLAWNISGTHLLVQYESAPTAIHLYEFAPVADESPVSTLVSPPGQAPRLATVLLHTRTITNAKWNPRRPGALAMCCGIGALYTWSDEWIGEAGPEEMAECVGIPASRFDVRELSWSPDGRGLLLVDKDSFCCAFEVEQENIHDEDEA